MIPGFKHEVWNTTPLVSWDSLYGIMEEDKIDCLWVLPDDPLSRDITYDWFNDIPPSFSWYSPPENIYDGQPYILTFKRRNPYGSPDKYIVFSAHMECAIPRSGDRGQWFLPDSMALNTTIDYIENELGIPYLWTNGNVGEQYLRKMHEDIKTHIRPLPKDQIEPFKEVLHGAMDRPVWRKIIPEWGIFGLSMEDMEKKFIVGFDKHGQYVGASNSVYLGNGGYEEVKGSWHTSKSYVGFWHYEVTDVSDTPFNGYDLPCPIDINRSWASEDLLEAANNVGVKFETDKGIIWEQQGRYLKKWASSLWQSRVNLRDPQKYPNEIARENAERTMKAIPNSMVGRFMNEYSKEYHHPDWQLNIIHQAITSQMYSLRKLADRGYKPVLVNKDAMYFLVEDSISLDFWIPREGLRGFKKIGVAPLSDAIIEAFSEEKSTNRLESLIKKEMKEYEHR